MREKHNNRNVRFPVSHVLHVPARVFSPFPPSPWFMAPKTPQLQFFEGLRVLVIDFPNHIFLVPDSLLADSTADVRS